jgi:hypothetical protein
MLVSVPFVCERVVIAPWNDPAIEHSRESRDLGGLLLLALASPVWPAMLRCTTYEEKTLNCLHTLCGAGTRAGSRYNTTLEQGETTITSNPRTSSTARMHPYTR